MDNEQLKKDIQNLIDDFRINYPRYKHEQEANTETKLVEPLFKLLGWTKEDFVKRESAHREGKKGFADYAFKIDGRIAFFLEVKRIGIPLEKEADKQVISYALSKRIPFAVSTNFEELKIFCVEQENATSQVFRVFKKPEDYISNLQNLMLLSKESFEKNLILKEAENEDRLKKRMSIDKILLNDLIHIRKIIVDNIEKTYPKKYEVNDKEEIVQRIIDRLIFIRRCEDVGMNPESLCLGEIKELPDNKAYPKLKEIFEKYNQVYNSGLFAVGVDNDCDIIKIDGLIIKNLIGYLYESKDKKYIYNFDWIDADVLRQVYEQYLGNILEQTKSGRTKLKDGQVHKKEQGIYYTPTYIVDYIVRNTLAEALKDKKVNLEKIKVLDCACGSGSFLIKAFDYLYGNLSLREEAKQNKIDSHGMYSVKTEILKNNIYGIDLDNKAVEITKLNLLLKASEPNRKLPKEVDLHIKHGNSLVDDENIDKSAFDWKGDFQEGSFDVVIGNPPYFNLQTIDDSRIINLFEKKYVSFRGKADILYLFIEKASRLLKQDGYFGMIVANYFLKSHYADKLRKLILSEFEIVKIVDFGSVKIFENANVDTCILIFRKKSKKQLTSTYSLLYNKDKISEFLKDLGKQKNISSSDYKISTISIKNLSDKPWLFSEKVSGTIELKELCEVGKGVATGNDDIFVLDKQFCEDNKFEKFMLDEIIEDSSIDRYILNISNQLLLRTKRGTDLSKCPNIRKYLESKKDILQKRYAVKEEGLNWFEVVRYNNLLFSPDKKERIFAYYRSPHNKFAYSNKQAVSLTTTFALVLKESSKVSLKYLLGILNSKLIQNFSLKNAKRMGGCFEFSSNFIGSIPIKVCDKKKETEIVVLVDKMLFLNEQLDKLGDKTTSETKELNDKIDSLDKEINEEIYKLYEITKEEQEIIEK